MKGLNATRIVKLKFSRYIVPELQITDIKI